MRKEWAAAALAASLLTGCAGVTTGVSALGQPNAFASGAHGYDFVRTAAQADDAEYRQIETLVHDELAQRGFDAQPGQAARYRLSIAYATQPASVAATADQCGAASSACVTVDGPAPFALPFAGKVYRHVLTLRFVDAKTGVDVYRVSASLRDRDALTQQAAPTLVKSALAKLPFEQGDGWLVKTKKDDAGAMPGVVSVKPAVTR
ncbi:MULTISPECIES: DUF4136 domain-containing protein [unclassified Burkholderia]|uniref:DUF4136 domain-containing protein n=1 Tax=unclassified Burkholderia TaxID=2613784 RepID=UPI0005CF089D|nr:MULTISPECIES: DUF4136 domain-containing protein [unclassified Burkholderia]RQR74672.1 DUF4136 domain-containing protein [Burkholderia sp. Bp9011]RQR86052.1 DUF4136 domain-containing protein [Burkholderia sp. Bp9010]RQR99875.1 DUF4136 domain-containing protein [Burkholderia sp. Bp8991]RQS48959.1 DUF4136 domain-containing protein [Burkholderia sp. Bp8986]RQS53336.1 DUF4136 domain-containing protein [Burkholderia sp. Bp8984]